jgi:sensitive to high expression protein 9
MRPLLQHASRSVFANASFIASSQASRSFVRTAARTASTPSVCAQCQHRTSLAIARSFRDRLDSKPSTEFLRRFHQTPNDERRPVEKERAAEPSVETTPTADVIEPPSKSTFEATKPDVRPAPKNDKEVGSIPSVPAEDLPSHREAQRWDFSKRLTELMDELLPKLAVVTQKVNSLTGTDYSGIEALKREIKEHGTWSRR